MFAGHVGAALAIGRAERRVNVGVFVGAALLLDFVLWVLVLLGWESVSIAADFASTHQAQFVFPYSHSLIAAVLWSALAAAVGWAALSRLPARGRAAGLVAAAVFSHWLLDALVHQPGLPVAAVASPMIGLGLWRNMPVALAVEAAIVVAGLYLFVGGSHWSRGKSIAIIALGLVTLVFTVIGMTVAPPPPSVPAMAGSSLVTVAVVCALVAWIGRPAAQPPAGRAV